ncbi:ICOS ligand-like [Clinocottus analis]|uniref:ICOS ligand-like n=1 Tax=Clinocottus analis TaxID=304258 RepID=UPI0035C1C9F2
MKGSCSRSGSLGTTLCVFGAQTARAAARCSLLLCFLTLCACLEENCILGIVGQPVSLPCVQPQITSSVNVTIWWRRGEELVLRSTWRADGVVEEWSLDGATTPRDAPLTGNVSLQLPGPEPTTRRLRYSLSVSSRENQSAELCSLCLRAAASFSPPVLSVEAELQPGGESSFRCESGGGFPEPAVFWLVDGGAAPEDAVSTRAAALPDSHRYNVTSRLTLNVSGDASVACVVQNPSTNETLTSMHSGAKVTAGPVVTSRASEAMWIFSTALCAVVGVLVSVGVVYQIHLDRISKRKKKQFQKQQSRGNKRLEEEEEEEELKMERKETDV